MERHGKTRPNLACIWPADAPARTIDVRTAERVSLIGVRTVALAIRSAFEENAICDPFGKTDGLLSVHVGVTRRLASRSDTVRRPATERPTGMVLPPRGDARAESANLCEYG
jgi:hypothetical protein